MAINPQPGVLNLTNGDDGDLRLRWFRKSSFTVTLYKDAALTDAYDFTDPADIIINSWQVQVRKKDTAETLVCIGTCTYSTDGSDGTVVITFPGSTLSDVVLIGWSPDGEADETCDWDLVGLTASSEPVQFLEGDADTLKTVTEVA
jgi:hypothetical protein